MQTQEIKRAASRFYAKIDQKAFRELRSAFPDMRATVEDMIAEGDKVACRVVIRMTHRGDFQGIRATGKEVVQSGIDILGIVDAG